MKILCFGCHTTLAETTETDARFPSGARIGGLCVECAPLGQIPSIRRRPRPCPCDHCTYTREHAAK